MLILTLETLEVKEIFTPEYDFCAYFDATQKFFRSHNSKESGVTTRLHASSCNPEVESANLPKPSYKCPNSDVLVTPNFKVVEKKFENRVKVLLVRSHMRVSSLQLEKI